MYTFFLYLQTQFILDSFNHRQGIIYCTFQQNNSNRNAINDTAIHLAVKYGHFKFFISDQNCDPNVPGQYGGTPLLLNLVICI